MRNRDDAEGIDIDLQKLRQFEFARAKKYWAGVNVCRLLVLLLSIVVIFVQTLVGFVAIVAAATSILSVYFQWRSDQLKGIAEKLLRLQELNDGLGWPVLKRDVADLILDLPTERRAQFKGVQAPSPYFASRTVQSPKRVLENVEESAWWSTCLTRRMSQYTTVVVLIMGALALGAMYTALSAAPTQPLASNIARAFVAVVAFLFTGGLIRLAVDYQRMSQSAGRVQEQASAILAEEAQVTEIASLKLLHEYHLIRATAPLIPEWIFRRLQPELDEHWRQYHLRKIDGD